MYQADISYFVESHRAKDDLQDLQCCSALFETSPTRFQYLYIKHKNLSNHFMKANITPRTKWHSGTNETLTSKCSLSTMDIKRQSSFEVHCTGHWHTILNPKSGYREAYSEAFHASINATKHLIIVFSTILKASTGTETRFSENPKISIQRPDLFK